MPLATTSYAAPPNCSNGPALSMQVAFNNQICEPRPGKGAPSAAEKKTKPANSDPVGGGADAPGR